MQNQWSAWKPWTGGPCPGDLNTVVEVLLPDGTLAPTAAKNVGWDFPQDPVVAYRVRETAAADAARENLRRPEHEHCDTDG
ncbi:hypothetical protein [Roseovarius sp.]|uniref:hypothetical protein n=1 Tax=Roseovarius sp. TaxID=1486281 RepID=UPI003BAC6C7C